ncbi:MAG: phage protein Gp37 [Sodalis sp. (in: enterobacteria)]|uniref:phage protein Gp37 n=1 Tax=Sodalis sp. (in: enterobacteria) TaxID=1898979 RepID=UPI0039E6459A
MFGNTLRDIATHPGDWSEEGLRDVLLTPPSVYLVWLGAQAGQVKGVIDSRFVFYVVADVINGAEGDRPGQPASAKLDTTPQVAAAARKCPVVNGWLTA